MTKPEECRELIKLIVDKASRHTLYEELDKVTDQIMTVFQELPWKVPHPGDYRFLREEDWQKVFGQSRLREEKQIKGEILAMKAGNELNAAVAKNIFNCDVRWQEMNDGKETWRIPYCGCEYKLHKHPHTPAYANDLNGYSGEILAAWYVVNKMREMGYLLGLQQLAGHPSFRAEFSKGLFPNEIKGEAEAESAPEAICKAALLARLEKSEKRDNI